MKSRKQKRMRYLQNYDGRDRLSEMPDEVIIHILSCMPTVYAVRTMLLRRFGNLWTLVHTLMVDMLDFCSPSCVYPQRERDENERMFVFVRNFLILHKRPAINKFHISVLLLSYEESVKASGEAKTWVRFALDKQATELIISDMSEYDFPGDFSVCNFTSQSLVTLVLNYCDVETQAQVNLPSLKKLSINTCVINNEVFQRFMRGCPSLQELEIKDPYCMEIKDPYCMDQLRLTLSAPNIDKLSLVISEPSDNRNPLPFDCPNLKTLDLTTFDALDIIDISAVHYINIQYVSSDEYNDDERTTLKYFYGKLDGAEVLHIPHIIVSHDFLDAVQLLNLSQHKWKRIFLVLWKLDQDCLVGIHHLIRSLRNLEELTISTTLGFKPYDLVPLEDLSPYVTSQLKTITLHGCGKTWRNQARLVKSLLKGATVLDKLIIVTTTHGPCSCWKAKPAEEVKFLKLVSSFPRASPTARVLFA